MKPPSFDNEVIVTTTSPTMFSIKSLSLPSLNELNNNVDNITQKDVLKQQQRELMFGIPLNSSQESTFEGFGTSPFGKLQRLFFSNSQSQQQQQQLHEENSNVSVQQKLSPGKMVFSKFYDTIVDENSCNAVDIQLPRDSVQTNRRRSSSESHKSINSDNNPSSELSFNGKIRILTKTQQSTVNCNNNEPVGKRRLSNLMETSLNTSQQFSDSFILKKYSNEKSPDLFGEDEDDEEEAAEGEENITAVVEDVHTENLNILADQSSTILNESQAAALMTCNLADNSLNCPTESSFAHDDQTMDCSLTQGSSFGVNGNSSDSYTLFRDNCRREREMLRRIRECLAGVLPPPSVTIPQLDMINAVLSKKNDIFNFFNDIKDESLKHSKNDAAAAKRPASLFRPTHSLDETKTMPWRDILNVRQHGLR